MAYEVKTQTTHFGTHRIDCLTEKEAREQAIQLADAEVDAGVCTVHTIVTEVREVA